MGLLKGTVRSYSAANGTAEVEVVGSHGQWVTVPVATDLDAKTVVAGKKCAILSFNDRDSGDAVLVATYDDTYLMGAAPLDDHAHAGVSGDGGQLEVSAALLDTGGVTGALLAVQADDSIASVVPGDIDAGTFGSGAVPNGLVLLSDGSGGAEFQAGTMMDSILIHDHTGDTGDGDQLEADHALLLTGGTDGYVLTVQADGSIDEEALPALANHDHSGDAGDGGLLEIDAALVATGATTGHVLTVQADDSIAAEAAAGATYPKRATMWHDNSIVTTGNAITVQHDANQDDAFIAYQNAGADGDVFTNGCYLRAGTYTFYAKGHINNNYGKIDWTLDGNSVVVGQDWYAASGVYNTIKSVASVVIATDGWHVLTGTVNGKHASSSGYYILLSKLWFLPAAD